MFGGDTIKLVKEVCPESQEYPQRYLLLTEVNDEDARILELCNMERAEEFDDEENEIEAWTEAERS